MLVTVPDVYFFSFLLQWKISFTCDLLLLHLPAVILGQETTLYTCYKNRCRLALMSQTFLRFLT